MRDGYINTHCHIVPPPPILTCLLPPHPNQHLRSLTPLLPCLLVTMHACFLDPGMALFQAAGFELVEEDPATGTTTATTTTTTTTTTGGSSSNGNSSGSGSGLELFLKLPLDRVSNSNSSSSGDGDGDDLVAVPLVRLRYTVARLKELLI